MTDPTTTPTTDQPPAPPLGRGSKAVVILLVAVMAAIQVFFAWQLVAAIVTAVQSVTSPVLIDGVNTIGWGAAVAFWGMVICSFARSVIVQRGNATQIRYASLALAGLAFASFAGSLAAIPGSDSNKTFLHVFTAILSVAFIAFEFGTDYLKARRHQRTLAAQAESDMQPADATPSDKERTDISV
ncbi:hypothetical protein [Frigoribacterium sp. SL97]|uniref:hypothetical protein n=1 Tax=Frigoribacterium sp. SL97 TaxID=2994664 RepID=UPI00226E6586|nr:hypothetical protein [Frigoribacterium sp. SL97]WAC50514.1 hypothetical protein OVA02_11590 [Frigoribacterium sp. SL97]